jgi:hypothetical protein
MTALRLALGMTLVVLCACGGPNLCERSITAATKAQGDCGDFVTSLMGPGCTPALSACTKAEQQLITAAVTCQEKLPVCSSIAKDAWRRAADGCTTPFTQLSRACLDAYFRADRLPFDAGTPDAGTQALDDGGNGLSLVGTSNADAIALAWEPRRRAEVARWLLVETDGLGDHRIETEFGPGTAINLTLTDAGMSGRRFFVVGLNQNGEVLTGMTSSPVVVDAGTQCQRSIDCAEDRVCDFGQCQRQTCVSGMANTCPVGYQCFSLGECRRTSTDAGGFNPGTTATDAGSAPLLMISNAVTLTARPPAVSATVALGSVPARRPDVAALDTARVAVALEQEGQLIAHASSNRGLDFADERGTSFGLDTTGTRVHLAWNVDSQTLFACSIVGRGVRVFKSVDRGRSWNRAGVVTFEPTAATDLFRDCDVAPWKEGGVALVTAEPEALVLRELTKDLAVTAQSPAFTSTPPDAGTSAIFAPSHPAIAANAPRGLVHLTFTGSRLLSGGAADTEPYGVYRDGAGGFSAPTRMTPSIQPSALPDDWTAVSIHPLTGQVIGAFTTVLSGVQNASTVFVSRFSAVTHSWNTGTDLNVFAVNQNTTVLLPQKAPTDLWFAFSPALAPLPNGTFAFSFVAGPKDNLGVGDYRQYLVPFDLDRVSAITNGKGWFVPPVLVMSDKKVVDPRGTLSAPQPPVSALTADTQISVYGAFIEGSGVANDVEGPAQYFHWP